MKYLAIISRHSVYLKNINDKIENKTVYVKYITLNTKRHGLNIKMLNYMYYMYIHINECIHSYK